MTSLPGFGTNGMDAPPPPPPPDPLDAHIACELPAHTQTVSASTFSLPFAGAQFVWTLDRGPVTTGEATLPKRDEEILE